MTISFRQKLMCIISCKSENCMVKIPADVILSLNTNDSEIEEDEDVVRSGFPPSLALIIHHPVEFPLSAGATPLCLSCNITHVPMYVCRL
jgi:hypothetical protein